MTISLQAEYTISVPKDIILLCIRYSVNVMLILVGFSLLATYFPVLSDVH